MQCVDDDVTIPLFYVVDAVTTATAFNVQTFLSTFFVILVSGVQEVYI